MLWDQFHLTADDLITCSLLRKEVTVQGGTSLLPLQGSNPRVAEHQIKEDVDLPQPDG